MCLTKEVSLKDPLCNRQFICFYHIMLHSNILIPKGKKWGTVTTKTNQNPMGTKSHSPTSSVRDSLSGSKGPGSQVTTPLDVQLTQALSCPSVRPFPHLQLPLTALPWSQHLQYSWVSIASDSSPSWLQEMAPQELSTVIHDMTCEIPGLGCSLSAFGQSLLPLQCLSLVPSKQVPRGQHLL